MSCLEEELEKISEWNYEIFHFAALSNNQPLQYIGLAALNHHGLVRSLNLSEKTVSRFLVEVEKKYRGTNPYHNSIHASDVCQSISYFLSAGGVGEILSDIEKFCCLIAAIIHDCDHPGKSNAFLINTKHDCHQS